MISKKVLIALIFVFSIGFVGTIFIIKSNDHNECDTVIEKYKNKKGDIVIRKKHVCKEKYSF
jgi:hypothetical protein